MPDPNPYRTAADMVRAHADDLVALGIQTTVCHLIVFMNRARIRAVREGGHNVATTAILHLANHVYELHKEADTRVNGVRYGRDGTVDIPVGTPRHLSVNRLHRLFFDLSELAHSLY